MINDTQTICLESLDKDKKPNFYKGKIFRSLKGSGFKWKVEQFFDDIKRAWQRAKNGYSRVDSWNICYWFIETMPHLLNDMLEDLHGFPGRGDANTCENWVAILQHMKMCFEEANEDTCSQKNEWEDTFEITDTSRINENGERVWTIVAEPEENWEKYKQRGIEIDEYRMARLKEGLDLFNKYFWDLWD